MLFNSAAFLLFLGAVVAMHAGTDVIVVAGSSRARAAIDVPTLARALGRPVFQLAQDGVPCGPMLDALARDARFAGTVLCALEPAGLFVRAHLAASDAPAFTSALADAIFARSALRPRASPGKRP